MWRGGGGGINGAIGEYYGVHEICRGCCAHGKGSGEAHTPCHSLPHSLPTPCYCYIPFLTPFPTPCPPCPTTTTPKAQQHAWSSCEARVDGRVGSSWLRSCSGTKWPCSGPNASSALPSTSNRRISPCCVQGTYCGGWCRCACLDAETRVFAVRELARTTCNKPIANLLFLSEVCVAPLPSRWSAAPAPTYTPIWGDRPCVGN
jgi:hypothetical protein